MKLRFALLAILLFAIPAFLWQQGVSSSVGRLTKTIDSQPSSSAHRFVGAGSCAAAACHNNNFAAGNTGSEYTTWITRDPHAKAYEVLFAERSLRIQMNLHRTTKAHEDGRCLKCHVAPNLDRSLTQDTPHFRTDGVSCESCHGPAEKWLNVHHLPAWKDTSLADKQEHGMTDTQTLLGRTQLCVQCHVGAPGMDVDHDLIAAGHPRLNFEFTAFHAHLPRHWPDAKDRDRAKSPHGRADFEAAAWVQGQLATTQAALALLADRAGDPKKTWPEFAEHDCLACHHDLQSVSWRQQKGIGQRKGAGFAWGNYATLTPRILANLPDQGNPQLLKLLSKIHDAMNSKIFDRQALAANAKAAASMLGPLQKGLAKTPLTQRSIDGILQSMLTEADPKAIRNLDEVAQVHLGLAALYQARTEMRMPALSRELQASLLETAQKLDLPINLSGPEAIRARQSVFKSLGHKKGS